jgi:hypothetical protein
MFADLRDEWERSHGTKGQSNTAVQCNTTSSRKRSVRLSLVSGPFNPAQLQFRPLPSNRAWSRSRFVRHSLTREPLSATRPRLRAVQFSMASVQGPVVRHGLGSDPFTPTRPRFRPFHPNAASFRSRRLQRSLVSEPFIPTRHTRFFKSSDFRNPAIRIILKIGGMFADFTDESETSDGAEAKSDTAWFQSSSVQRSLV